MRDTLKLARKDNPILSPPFLQMCFCTFLWTSSIQKQSNISRITSGRAFLVKLYAIGHALLHGFFCELCKIFQISWLFCTTPVNAYISTRRVGSKTLHSDWTWTKLRQQCQPSHLTIQALGKAWRKCYMVTWIFYSTNKSQILFSEW